MLFIQKQVFPICKLNELYYIVFDPVYCPACECIKYKCLESQQTT